MAEIGANAVYLDQDYLDLLKDDEPIPEELRKGRAPDYIASFLYTSGTTGLPKAVKMISARDLIFSHAVPRYLRLKPSDRMYTCLPLYHGTAHGLWRHSLHPNRQHHSSRQEVLPQDVLARGARVQGKHHPVRWRTRSLLGECPPTTSGQRKHGGNGVGKWHATGCMAKIPQSLRDPGHKRALRSHRTV